MVVTTMYVYVVPFLYQTQHPLIFALYVLYGHYLLIMICFNYFSGVYTRPGTAPKVIVGVVTFQVGLMTRFVPCSLSTLTPVLI